MNSEHVKELVSGLKREKKGISKFFHLARSNTMVYPAY